MGKDRILIEEAARRLREARQKAKIDSAAEAARRFGWNPNTYASHENGNRGFSRSAARQYASAYKVPLAWLLNGSSEPATVEVVRQAPVVGEVAAGVWREDDVWDVGKYADVPVVNGRFGHLPQYAFRVSGGSMDLLRIFDGDFVVCVEYWEARTAHGDGDVVVVCRRRGALVERTVKQIAADGSSTELWPRSSDPRFQSPIVVKPDGTDADGALVEITHLVISAVRNFT